MQGLPGPSGRLRTTWAVIHHPEAAYARWRARYGDTFVLRVTNGDVVVSCDPAFVQDYLKLTDDEHAPFAIDAVRGVLGAGSMIAAGGAAHRRQRRLVGPHFGGERMRAYAGVVGEIARARVAAWRGELRLMDEMRPISQDVIIRAVFGAESEASVARYRGEIDDVIRHLSPLFFFSPGMQRRFLGLGPWGRFCDARARLGAHLRADVEARRASGALGDDILSCLAGAVDEDGSVLSVDEVCEQLWTLLFAGHETTQIALAWAVYWLLKTPDALARLRAELAGAGSDPVARARLPYLDAVAHETLRLHPIVPDNQRTLTVAKVLGGVSLPAGCHVAVAAAMTHMRADLYPEPGRFRPERFVEERARPWAFLPFGGGVRRCIGAGLAMFELKVVLAEVVMGAELRLLGDEVAVRRNITMAPKGVRVRVG
ncbi:MAG: cytochrome P450 [bacterium]